MEFSFGTIIGSLSVMLYLRYSLGPGPIFFNRKILARDNKAGNEATSGSAINMTTDKYIDVFKLE